jgi:hypothetical protein
VRGTRLALAPLAALAIAATALGASPAHQLVKQCYASFERALVERNGETALRLLSAGSLREWERLVRLALRGSIDEIEALPPGHRLAVLALRHQAPTFLRAQGSEQDRLVQAVRSGLLDRDAAGLAEMGDVALQGERASGLLVVAGLPSGFRAGFVREDGAWRVDLGSSLDGVGRVVTGIARANRVGESAVIVNLLAAASGRRVGGEVWRPLEP